MNIKLKFYLDKEATPNFKLDWQGELKDLNDKFNSSQMCSLAVQSVRGSDREANDLLYSFCCYFADEYDRKYFNKKGLM